MLLISAFIYSSEPPTHRYINEEDIKAGRVRKLTDAEIRTIEETSLGPDADDLLVFRQKPVVRAPSSQNPPDSIMTGQSGSSFSDPNKLMVRDR